MFKKIVVFKLNLLAKMYLWRYKPEIIAITGNVGKTSTKEAIAAVLSKFKNVRSGKGNLNNEFGVPLTIIGDWADDYYEGGNSIFFWSKALFVSFFSWFGQKNYPEILVLEYGADKPGDIKKLAKKFKPHIGVVTAVGEVPVHVEYFSSPQALAREKSKLVEALGPSDYAILNADDAVVLDMQKKTKAKVMTYGFGPDVNVGISNFDFRIENGKPAGISFKINHKDGFVPMRIDGSLGKSQAWAAAAAAAVGVIKNINMVEIGEALLGYSGPKGRLRIIPGIKGTTIIDDTYNASPSSTHLALETLKDLPAKRRIVVLGDMLELGKYTVQAHQEIGNIAGGIASLLITAGLRAKFIAYAAMNQMDERTISSFINSEMAKKKVQDIIEEGDLILVKGSQGVRMEKIVEEIMAEPQNKKDLLVRQGRKWSRSTAHKM